MLVKEVKKLSPYEKFIYWIRERQSILNKRREGLPKPWTDDDVLQSYYFCNVRREDDKVSVWLRENIRNPLKDKQEVMFAVIAFRWFNYIPTGELLWNYGKDIDGCCNLLEKWNLDLAIAELERFKEAGNQVFTGAFNISNGGVSKPKINRVCEDYIQPIWEDRENLYNRTCDRTLEQAHKVFKRLPGLGGSGFMAAQIIADLKYTHMLENAEDWMTWCSPGPGSRRGMNRLHGIRIELTDTRGWDKKIKDLQDKVNMELEGEQPTLHAQDLQSCLCEFSKYCVGLEEGSLKRTYNGS